MSNGDLGMWIVSLSTASSVTNALLAVVLLARHRNLEHRLRQLEVDYS